MTIAFLIYLAVGVGCGFKLDDAEDGPKWGRRLFFCVVVLTWPVIFGAAIGKIVGEP